MTTANRRDFMTGRALADNVRERVSPATIRTSLVHYTRRAMACGFTLFVPAPQRHDPQLAVAALELVEDLERLLSVYREDSEISIVNRLAAQQAVRVDPRVLALLSLAKELWVQTDGAFDITAGPLARLWGISNHYSQLPDVVALHDCLSQLGCDKLLLDATNHTVRFSRAGPEINLGGIGKGFALDECRRLLDEHGIKNFMLHGGLSSVLARGHQGGEDTPWMVDLRLPRPGKPLLARLPVTDMALATSGDAEQHFEVGGVRFGHILDPRNGQPAGGMELATVFAPSAAEADALSTAFFVMGVAQTVEFCRQHPAVSAILVTRRDDDSAGDACVHAVGRLPAGIVWGEFPSAGEPPA